MVDIRITKNKKEISPTEYFCQLGKYYFVSKDPFYIKILCAFKKKLGKRGIKNDVYLIDVETTGEGILLDFSKDPPELKIKKLSDLLQFVPAYIKVEISEDEIQKAKPSLNNPSKKIYLLIGAGILILAGILLFPSKKEKKELNQPTVGQIVNRTINVIQSSTPVCKANIKKTLENFVPFAEVIPVSNSSAGPSLNRTMKLFLVYKNFKINVSPVKIDDYELKIYKNIGITQLTVNKNPFVFVGDDYDLCVDFMLKNQNAPLTVLYLSRNATKEGYKCIFVIDPNCLLQPR